ncbi:VWA domain-containing protein [Delftia sp. PS-11]|uniref:VWA domain-containing protein n=1 Tax=Delftia sp. PS-11 TaxID=2767222 RepID=UPI00245841AA|nr:VWA domain-containing protein [Delftia sp. PS-11]KAJ8741794.1 VWA domain-containing protein [Delftia sp. PS-11]
MSTLLAAQLAKLSEFDFTVAIDTSGSMGEPVKAGSSITRWQAVQESALTFIRDIEKIDSDGLGLVLFGGTNVKSFDGVTSDKVREVFAGTSPRGTTPLAEALGQALALAGKSDKKDFVIVFTDGVPDDRAAAARIIIEASNRQETDDALTFLFIQVGDDAGATTYLRQLDDDLSGAKFDIVDVKTVAEADAFASTAEMVLAAIDG